MPKRQLTDIRVEFISLVARPATGKKLTLKCDGTPATFEIVKMDPQLHRAYGIVYTPDVEDSQGDRASKEEIFKAATDFMRNGRVQNVDVEHSFSQAGAFVAESWIVRKGDAMFPKEPEGAWAVGIQVENIDLWADLEKGNLVGLSLAGVAVAEPATKSTAAKGWPERLKSFITTTRKGGNDMDKATEEKLVKGIDTLVESMETLVKAVGSQNQPAQPAPATQPAAADTAQLTKADAEKMIGDAVEKAVSKAQSETQTEMVKTLAEALAKGRSETSPGGGSVENEMV